MNQRKESRFSHSGNKFEGIKNCFAICLAPPTSDKLIFTFTFHSEPQKRLKLNSAERLIADISTVANFFFFAAAQFMEKQVI